MLSHLLPTLAVLLPGIHLAQAQRCSHQGLKTEAPIPFLNNPNNHFDFNTTPRVNVWFSHTVGGVEGAITRSYEFLVDTGSTGILMAASALEDWNEQEATKANVGFHFLTSSKLLYTGSWVERNVYFNRGTGDEVKAVVNILAVTRKTYCPDYKLTDKYECPYPTAVKEDYDKVRVMGIGFGRSGDGQPQGTPDKNPFLNITQIRHIPVGSPSLPFWPGWKITPAGLIAGLTESNYDVSGFGNREVRLSETDSGSGSATSMPRRFWPWGELPGCVSIDNVPSPCLQCSVLLDTGVDQSYIRVRPSTLTYPTHPETGTANHILDAGQTVDISFGPNRAASETFKVDDTTNKVTPRITYNYHDDARFPFVNTGRHVFRAWEVAFDPLCGIVAFHEAV